MAAENPEPQPIIIKKKIVHGGSHGGAWKVAYADFVTAMMALFIVLWLMNTSDNVKKSIASYFRDPSGVGKNNGSGEAGVGEGIDIRRKDMSKLKDKLEEAMKQAPELAKLKNQVDMTVTGEGLRVELLENAKGMFFDSGDARPTQSGEEMLRMLAAQLGKLPNHLFIEGHTDARPFAKGKNYTNWELSADRANAARRLMEQNGLRPDQVVEVRGFADEHLRKPNDPDDPSNRRVSIIVQYLPLRKSPLAAKAAAAPKKKEAH
jgi:chemotaxis protein MotB